LDYRELVSALTAKGHATEDRSGNHIFYMIEIDGKRYRATKISHSARGQISDGLVGAIAREMHLHTKELKDFVGCTISRDEWLGYWKERTPFYNQ
jgi:hypothetical protein